jgi:hypothetical protein
MVCAFRTDTRGVRVVTNVERNAVDESMLKTCGIEADGEVVWSWRAHAGAKWSRSSKGFAEMTVANAGSPGRARYKP